MSIRKGSTVIASYISDGDVVHRTGTETISGVKTFKNIPVLGTYEDNTVEGGEIWFQKGDTDPVLDSIVKVDVYNGLFRIFGSVSGTTVLPFQIDFANNKIMGTATTALWADLAEKYQSDQEYPIGTLICFGGEKDITVAKVNCNGVISDKPGYLLDSDLENAQPVALVGKTPIRILGKVKKFDRIVLDCENPGIGKVQTTSDEKVIGIALEASEIEEEKLVLCVTKFNLD